MNQTLSLLTESLAEHKEKRVEGTQQESTLCSAFCISENEKQHTETKSSV